MPEAIYANMIISNTTSIFPQSLHTIKLEFKFIFMKALDFVDNSHNLFQVLLNVCLIGNMVY